VDGVVEAGGGVEEGARRTSHIVCHELAARDAGGDDSLQLPDERSDVGPDHVSGIRGQLDVGGEELGVVELAVHVTTDPGALALLGMPLPDAPEGSPEEEVLNDLRDYQTEGVGYLKLQGKRAPRRSPMRSDSPVGQLAWIVEEVKE